MGFLGEIFHPQHDEVEKPAEAASSAKPEIAETTPAPPDSAAPPTNEAGAKDEVKPGGSVDTVTASGDSSTVDLGSVQVSPVNSESSNPDTLPQSEGTGVSAESTASSDATGETIEKNATEPTSTPEPSEVNISVDPDTSVESTESTGEEVQTDGEDSSSKSGDSNKSAEELLAEWQQEKPGEDATKAAPDEASSQESQHTTEPNIAASEGVPAESGESQKPEASTDDTKEDLAHKLTQEAAAEAGAIDDAMGALGKDTEAEAPAKLSDEAAVSGDTTDDNVSEVAGEDVGGTDSQSAELVKPVAEEVSFPELKPEESEASVVGDDAQAQKDDLSDNPEATQGAEVGVPDEPDSVGGENVHLDRAEYLTDGTTEDKAGYEDRAGKEDPVEFKSTTEVVDIATVRKNIAKARTALDELEALLDKAA